MTYTSEAMIGSAERHGELSQYSLSKISLALDGIKTYSQNHDYGVWEKAKKEYGSAIKDVPIWNYDEILRHMASTLLDVVPRNIVAIRINDAAVVMRSQKELQALKGLALGWMLSDVDQYAAFVAKNLGCSWETRFPPSF